MVELTRRSLSMLLVGVAALVFGCAQPEVPAGKFYRIYAEQPNDSGGSGPRLDGVLVVRPFLADGLVSERLLVFGEASAVGSMQQYHYHSWTESPTRMVQEQLVTYLRGAAVAEEVITPEMRVDARYELSGKIRRFEQIRGESPQIIVELEFGLLEPRAGRLLIVKNYRAQVACEDESIDAAVLGFNAAISQVFEDFLEDLWAI